MQAFSLVAVALLLVGCGGAPATIVDIVEPDAGASSVGVPGGEAGASETSTPVHDAAPPSDDAAPDPVSNYVACVKSGTCGGCCAQPSPSYPAGGCVLADYTDTACGVNRGFACETCGPGAHCTNGLCE